MNENNVHYAITRDESSINDVILHEGILEEYCNFLKGTFPTI